MKTLPLLVVLLLAACHGRTQYHIQRSPASVPEIPTQRRPIRAGRVFLSDQDLAPLDRFIHARNAQWIVGDVVNVTASREYFAQVLTVNATLGTVKRTDTTRADATQVVLDYLGAEGTANVTTCPRILIGTGLTVMARKRLVLRLVKTTDAAVPVSLRIQAEGNASRGRKDDVLHRGPALTLGGAIRLQNGRYLWFPIG